MCSEGSYKDKPIITVKQNFKSPEFLKLGIQLDRLDTPKLLYRKTKTWTTVKGANKLIQSWDRNSSFIGL